MAKIDAQSSRLSTRFSRSARGGALIDEEEFDRPAGGAADSEDAFFRPSSATKPSSARVDPQFRDGREVIGPEIEDDQPFLRTRKRVPVHRSFLPQGRWGRIGFAAGGLILLAALLWFGVIVRSFLDHDPRFRIESSENIQILGNSQVTNAELLGVFGSDIGRNVFFVPLNERRKQLDELPWVEQATVMRLLPDQLRVSVVERTPIAFVRNGNEIGLVDLEGVLLAMDPKTMAAEHYSFPVLTGISSRDAQSTRAARMKLYRRFVSELDASGERISEQLSEVDISDPEDVRALVPSEGADILLHFGDQDFLSRYRNYQQHLAEWKQQYPQLASVDLRYERQVVLEMKKGTVTGPNQDAAGKTIDDLKAEAATFAPTAKPANGSAAKRKNAARTAKYTTHAPGRSTQGRN